MEGAGGVDFPSLVCPPTLSNFSAIDSGRPPFTRSVKVLETEANWIDLAVATGALSLLLMGTESFAGSD